MKMTWHHMVFDKVKQIVTGNILLPNKGRLSHGIVIVQISDGNNQCPRYNLLIKLIKII